jgi:hypothetical protein
MKKLVALIVFCLATYGFAFAQPKFPELDKIKQIKLLESTRDDVKRIFSEYTEDFEDDDDDDIVRDEISTKNIRITFSYSLGSCSDDDEEAWNVAKGKVTEINVLFRKSVKAQDLKIDLSKLERIEKYEKDEDDEEEEDPDDFVYYDKGKNISYGLEDGEIKNIKFTPSEKDLTALCNNETVREFTTNKEWLIEKLKHRPYVEVGRPFANVDELILSKNEFTPDCPANDSTEAENDFEYAKITAQTKASSTDPTDVLTYNYTVSGGKIIGTGVTVTWDLSGVKPGEYTITAGVDNGCGICGTTKTLTVVVKDYPDCKPK